METSLTLARIIGPFYLLIGAGLLLNQTFFARVAKEMGESPALFYLSGLLAFVLGAVIVTLHNEWSGWPIVVTLIGWAGVLKGVVRLLAPEKAQANVRRLLANPNTLTASALVALALGAYLTAMSYWLAA